MDTLARLQARLDHLQELGEVVSAMRALAASHVQQARARLVAINAYTATIEQGLARVASQAGRAPAPEANLSAALLLMGGEHGFAGDFTERLVNALVDAAGPRDRLLVAGARAVTACEERGLDLHWRGSMVSHPEGVLAIARGAVDEIYELIAASGVRRLLLVYGHAGRAGGFDVALEQLLPFDLAAYADDRHLAPLTNLPPALLVEQLVDEFVLARVVHAGMESLAAENAARLRATTSAMEAIDERVEDMQERLRQVRQETITAELAELVSGGAFGLA